MQYTIRKAVPADCAAIEELVACSARALGAQDYSSSQIEGALRGAFGVDTELINDGTYFVAEADGMLVGCGGWSKRKTLFGGDKHAVRDSGELDPASEPAKIRAFFVHPEWSRMGIGKNILAKCESEALMNGFLSLELMATLPGVRLYHACGFKSGERVIHELAPGLEIEFVRMTKSLKLRV